MEYMESKMQDQIDGGISENERLHAELSRLRDLVREMREALDHATRFRSDGLGFVAGQLIAKADAALKEIGEPVKYGCHHNDTVTDECAIDTNSPLCITARALAKNGFQKEQCSYWRPIK